MNAFDIYYIDTSALLPYYREEPVSGKIQDFFTSLIPPVCISDLTKVEFASALARWVRMDELSDAQADLVRDTFAKDINKGLFLNKKILSIHCTQAERWLVRRKTALRTLDALHMACCWDSAAILVTCDRVMHQSAEVFGIDSRLIF